MFFPPLYGRQVAQIEMFNDKKGIINEISDLSYNEQLSVTETQELYERTCSRLLHQEMKTYILNRIKKTH